MPRRRPTDWRDSAAAELLARHLALLGPPGPTLVMGDTHPDLVRALEAESRTATLWNRRSRRGAVASPWPQAGPYRAAALRHPRGKEELTMSLHAAAASLGPGRRLLLYGANDEGIRSASELMDELFTEVDTAAVGGRCRVIRAIVRTDLVRVRSPLREWRRVLEMDHPEVPPHWVSYPGVFAHGRLDEGTRLLLDVLPALPPGARVLDYGCGSGIVGLVAAGRGEGLRVEMLDVDSVALEAAKENVPGARFHLHDGLLGAEEGPFDAIFSNPPFHRGKAEDPGLVTAMIREAPALLSSDGVLVFVVQRRLPVEGELRARFGGVSILAETSTFRVWGGRVPLLE